MYATLSSSLKLTAWRGLLLLLVLLLGCQAGRAQQSPAGAPRSQRKGILNDSSTTLYGPKTTRVIYEREARRDSVGGTIIDTALTKFPQSRFWLHDSTFQQDLGAMGTASRPLLYQPNLALGTRFGRNVFDRYTRDASQVPYYDSRSPYSFFRFIQSSEGEQVFELSYSRSLKENFSIGVDYERIASNQVLYTAGNQWLVEHNNFTVFGRYQTEDGRYHLLANYTASRQRTREQGGIWPTDNEASLIRADSGRISNALFNYENERTYLSSTSNPAINIDDRDQFHLFQSYRLARRGFTAYHIFDIRRQYNGYNDDALPRDANGNLLFYPIAGPYRGTYRNASATNDRATYRQAENTLGLLGRTDRIEYNIYGRVRNASLEELSTATGQIAIFNGRDTTYVTTGRSGAGLPLRQVYRNTYLEAFVGGTAAFNYRTIYAVEVSGEYKFFDEYWLRGSIRTGPLSAELLTSSYSPTLTQRVFIGNHYVWPDTLGGVKFTESPNTKANQLTVRLQQKLPFLSNHSIDASVALVNLTNLIYYNQQGVPDQLSTAQQLLVVFARHRFRVGKFFFDNQGTYTRGAGPDNPGLRIPELVTESRSYYQTNVFKKALLAQLGLEFYYQSRFQGYNYAPSTQQFYVQDKFTMQNFGVANAFLTADIKAASIFLKVAYLNQGVFYNGYFTTPYFTGYPRRFQLGVRWRFFN